jgi:DNA-binding HxlR family transcriptional regulator
MTTNSTITNHNDCPGQDTVKVLTAKWVPQILKHTMQGPVRFNTLVRSLEGSSKQSVSAALDKLEDNGFISRKIVKQKPLHIEYNLTQRGESVLQVFRLIAQLPEKEQA